MDDEDDGPHEVAHYFLLAVVMLMILASLLVSKRPVTLANQPDIVPVATIPDQVLAIRAIEATGYSRYLVPQTRVRPEITAALAGPPREEGPVTLGDSVRQISFLGLPLFATREIGPVLYRDSGWAYSVWPLDEPGLASLRTRFGDGFGAGRLYGLWLTSWGLLAPIAVALFGWLEFRRQARRRERLGLI